MWSDWSRPIGNITYFLSIAFNLPPEWREIYPIFRAIASSSHFQRLLDEYKFGHETLAGRCYLFNKLANYAIEVLAEHFSSEEVEESIIFCRNDYVPPTDSLDERFPDCVVVHESRAHHDKRIGWGNLAKENIAASAFHWSETLVFVKFYMNEHGFDTPSSFHINEALRQRQGGNPPQSRQDAVAQCTDRAFGMLSHTSISPYALGMFIADGDLELFHYNRYEPALYTNFNFLQYPSRLVALLYCLQYSTPTHLSFPLSSTANGNPHSLTTLYSSSEARMDLTLNLDRGVNTEHSNLANNQHVLFGRETRVVRFFATEGDDKPDGAHRPRMFRYKVLPSNITNPQFFLSAYLDTEGVKYEYKNKALQTLAAIDLSHVTKLTTTDALLPVVRDVFNGKSSITVAIYMDNLLFASSGYIWAYQEAKIMRRDLSLYNIMYREEGGKIHGVIIDSDSSLSNRQMLEPRSKRWAGTQA
jgi:hypothetical protein